MKFTAKFRLHPDGNHAIPPRLAAIFKYSYLAVAIAVVTIYLIAIFSPDSYKWIFDESANVFNLIPEVQSISSLAKHHSFFATAYGLVMVTSPIIGSFAGFLLAKYIKVETEKPESSTLFNLGLVFILLCICVVPFVAGTGMPGPHQKSYGFYSLALGDVFVLFLLLNQVGYVFLWVIVVGWGGKLIFG